MRDVETELVTQWKDLALRAIDAIHAAERETDWGQPTFGPSVWERLRDEQNELLAATLTPTEGQSDRAEVLADRLMTDFYCSKSYDPHATRNGDTVKAAIEFTIRALSTPPEPSETKP